MRILFVTRKFPPSVGGMEVFAEELSQALLQKNPETLVFKPDPPILGRPGLFVLLRFFVKAALAIWSNAKYTDVVLFGDAVLTPLGWIAKLGSRGNAATVVTAHGNDVYYARRKSVSGRMYRTTLKWSSRHADLLIANSSDTLAVAKSLGFRHGVKIRLATRLSPQSHASKPPEPSILFAGRLMRCKGLGWFINDVLPMIDQHITLLVAGPEWDPEEMSAVVQCNRAHYVGTLPRDSLPALRSQCLACIMPSLPAHLSGQNEGFGLSALESAAVGVPVVASNLGGLAEAIVDNVTGFLIPPLDATAFAGRINAIANWSNEQRIDFAAGARRTIVNQFTWDRVAGDYLDQFEHLMQTRRSIPA